MPSKKIIRVDLYSVSPDLIKAGEEYMKKMQEYSDSDKILKILENKKKK